MPGWVRVAAPHQAATGTIPWHSPPAPSGRLRTSVDLSGSITATVPLSVFTNKLVPSSAIQVGGSAVRESSTRPSGRASPLPEADLLGTADAADSLAAPESPVPPGSPLHAERTAATAANAAMVRSCRGLAPTGSSLPHIPVKVRADGPFQVCKAGSCRTLERIRSASAMVRSTMSWSGSVSWIQPDALSSERYVLVAPART